MRVLVRDVPYLVESRAVLPRARRARYVTCASAVQEDRWHLHDGPWTGHAPKHPRKKKSCILNHNYSHITEKLQAVQSSCPLPHSLHLFAPPRGPLSRAGPPLHMQSRTKHTSTYVTNTPLARYIPRLHTHRHSPSSHTQPTHDHGVPSLHGLACTDMYNVLHGPWISVTYRACAVSAEAQC